MTTNPTPRCDHRSEYGLGCARNQGHEGAHWLTAHPDEARADLARQGIGRPAYRDPEFNEDELRPSEVKPPLPTTEIRYAGLTIKPGYEGNQIVWRVLENGMNILPGATYGHTEEQALQLADVLLAVDRDGAKFWHLLRAIQRQTGGVR
jgi:hypothetical protein